MEPKDRCALAVDIGGTSTKLGIVRTDGAVVLIHHFPTRVDTGKDYLVRLRDEIIGFTKANSQVNWKASGIGVSIAGLLDEKREGISFNPNLPFLEGLHIRSRLAEEFGCPVVLDADSNAAAVGEWAFGSGHGAARFLCLTIGTGIGAGLLIDSEVVRLYRGCLGDAGHVLVRPGGQKCANGCIGCAEAEIAAPALERVSGTSARELIAAAHRQEPRAVAILDGAGLLLGLALASLAAVFWPDRIAIAGGVSEAGETLLEAARLSFTANAGKEFQQGLSLVKARLGSLAPLVGSVVPLWRSRGDQHATLL